MTFPNNDNNNNPWILKKKIYNKNGTLIYDIEYNQNSLLTPEIISELNNNDWIMKMSCNSTCKDEIYIINHFINLLLRCSRRKFYTIYSSYVSCRSSRRKIT